MDKSRWLWLLPRIQDILFIAIFLAVLAMGQKMLNLDGDLPRHLLTGRLIVETRAVPGVEPFAYPYEGRVYVSHEWLADVLFYAIFKALGLPGLVLLAALLLASAFTLLFAYASVRWSVRLPFLLLLIWGAGATSLNWAIRPHLISMLLLALWLVWSDRLARGEKVSIWRMALFMGLWSNLHGEFIAGILVLLAQTAGWTVEFILHKQTADRNIGRRLWAATLVCITASLCNPAGYHPYQTILGFVNNSYLMSRMAEANPPDFSNPSFRILLGLLAVSIILLAVHPKRLSTGQSFLLAGFSAMSLLAARNIHLYGLVAPFVLAETLAGSQDLPVLNSLEKTIQTIEKPNKYPFWPAISVLLLTALLMSKGARQIYTFSPAFFPVEAVNWLEDNPQQGRLYNDLNWGGYIAWRLWPGQKVFVDSMADVTGELTQEYETVLTTSDGWQEVFTKYRVEWVILPPQSKLASMLSADPNWQTLHSDATATVLRKK